MYIYNKVSTTTSKTRAALCSHTIGLAKLVPNLQVSKKFNLNNDLIYWELFKFKKKKK